MTQISQSRFFLQWFLFSSFGFLALNGCGPKAAEEEGVRAPRYDVELEQVTSGSCLNLAKLHSAISALSDDNMVRRHTSTFTLGDATTGGAVVRRNFIALASIANFHFEETPASIFARDLPTVFQKDCSQVELHSSVEGKSRHQILSEGTARELVIQYDETYRVKYTLIDKRTLRIAVEGLAQDPCPGYPQTVFSRVEEVSWGRPQELEKKELLLDREYLKKIAIALPQLPPRLAAANTYDTRDLISVSASDLRSIKHSRVDNSILKCPFSSSAPSEEEPAPIVRSELDYE